LWSTLDSSCQRTLSTDFKPNPPSDFRKFLQAQKVKGVASMPVEIPALKTGFSVRIATEVRLAPGFD